MRIGNIILLLFLMVAAPFAAGGAQERVTVSGDNAKMFKGPSFDGASTPVVRGTTLTVLERKGDWVRVYDGKTDGFVHNAFLALVAAPPAAPAPAPTYPPQATYPPPAAYPPQTAYPPQSAYPPGYPPQPGYQPAGVTSARMPGTAGYKDPSTARILSVVFIGGGQFYSGETGKGLLLAGLGYGAPIVASMFIYSSANDCVDDIYSGTYTTCDTSNSWGAAVLVAWAVTLSTWIYGIVDADNAAMRTNAKPMHFGVMPSVHTDGQRVYGALNFRFR